MKRYELKETLEDGIDIVEAQAALFGAEQQEAISWKKIKKELRLEERCQRH